MNVHTNSSYKQIESNNIDLEQKENDNFVEYNSVQLDKLIDATLSPHQQIS